MKNPGPVLRHQPGLQPALVVLREESERLGLRSSLVGGYVRDRLLNRDCKDIDVVVEQGGGLDLAAAVAERTGGRAPVVFERFGTAQVSFQDFHLEFVSARAESYDPASRKPEVRPGTLEEDTWRRDFTCNTLLSDYAGHVSDITGRGLDDLAAGVLRTPLPAADTFAEDPLRMVRAVRFAAVLDFSLAPDIIPAIGACLPRLRPGQVVSMERINEELRKMLLSARPGRAMELLLETGILELLMPEVAAMAGVAQTGFHDRDVFGHTVAALEASASPRHPQVPEDNLLVTRLGILLHDVGKPPTAARDGERVTFLGHPEVGATIARELLTRLRFSNDDVDAVTRLVTMHMRPIQYDPVEWSDGAVRRLVRDSGNLLAPLLELARVDMAASSYPGEDAARKLGDLTRRIDRLDADAVRSASAPLTGHALMARYGRPPGPWLGRVRAALLDAVLEGEIPVGPDAADVAWAYLEAHPELLEVPAPVPRPRR